MDAQVVDQKKRIRATIVGKLAIGPEIVRRSPTSRTALTVLTGRVLVERRVRDRRSLGRLPFPVKRLIEMGERLSGASSVAATPPLTTLKPTPRKPMVPLLPRITRWFKIRRRGFAQQTPLVTHRTRSCRSFLAASLPLAPLWLPWQLVVVLELLPIKLC